MKKKRVNFDTTTIPLPVLVGETRIIYEWCQTDKFELVSFGLKWEIVETLPVLCNNSEASFINCKIEKISLLQYKKNLEKKFKAASQTRGKISERIRYSLDVADNHHTIPAYHRRRANSEIVEDLFNLAAMCNHFKELLERTGFDHNQAESLKQLSLELQKEHITYNVMVRDYRELRKLYFCTYHELYKAVQSIRKCAFEVFPPGSPRRNGYHSQYRKTHK